MRRKRANKIESAATSFARWRLMLGLSQEEAAARLHKSRRAVQDYERATKPVVPDYAARVLMDIMAKGQEPPSPWPE
jgi:DNA-binding transcriptional regulator YiaG